MKTVHTPHLGRDVKLGGRKARRVWGPHLQLGKYLRAAMPDTPASCDYTAQAMASLSNVYDNDTLGCCVIAGLNHVMGVETGNADGGQPVVVTNDQIVKEYGAIGGYVPGDAATDQGCDEKTAFDYYSQQGWSNGTKAAGYLAVDATNRAEVQAAIYLFENVIYGVSLPDGWVNPFPGGNGFTWDVAGAPDPQNGHCFVAAGYDATGTKICTWGLLGTLTWAANAAYAVDSAQGGMLWVILSPDEISKAQSKAPNGVDWSSLVSDFDAIGGNIQPTPPVPAPSPAPNGSVSLAQAQSWASGGLSAGFPLLTRGQAVSVVNAALAKNWPGP